MSGTSEVQWFLGVVLCVDAFAIFACLGFGWERRPHFAGRIVLLLLVPAVGVLLAGLSVATGVLSDRAGVTAALLVLFACVPAMALIPRVLFRRSDSSSGGSDGGPGSDGGGPGPDRPSPVPLGPTGGLPLPDSAQARWRVRDHRPDRRLTPPRRPSREPERPPVRR